MKHPLYRTDLVTLFKILFPNEVQVVNKFSKRNDGIQKSISLIFVIRDIY